MSGSDAVHPLKEQEFKRLQKEGKQLAAEGRLQESLERFECAQKICPTPKVLQRIEKLKSCLLACGDCLKEEEAVLPEISCNFATKEDAIFRKASLSKSKDRVSSKVLHDIQNTEQSNVRYLNVSKPSSLNSQELSKFKELKELAKQLSYNEQYEEAIECFQKALTIYDCPSIKRYIEEIQAKTASEVTDLVDEEKLAKVKALYYEARDLASGGELEEALVLLKKAQSIRETMKVQKQIKKIEEVLSCGVSGPEGDEMIKIVEDFPVYKDIYHSLYPYQREGVAWMWRLYKMKKGGILGDDMGLGKTFQVIAFLSGMIDADFIKHVLIVMPVSLLLNWEKEFKKWAPGIVLRDFHGGSKKDRERNLLKIQRNGNVLLTSYGMVVNNLENFTCFDDEKFVWDYVILDEGHKIKNPTKTTKAVHDIPAKNRLILTGTPIQNNLKELWSLYDFVQQGTLLGTLKTFRTRYEIPIIRSREKDATAGEKRLGTEMAKNLKSLIKPYFLRRTKEEIRSKRTEEVDLNELEDRMRKIEISELNVRKNDLILWTFMSDSQIEIYNSFLHSDAVKAILVSKRSPLVELTTLKKICDHPRLLSKRACFELGLNGEINSVEDLQELESESSSASSIDNVSDETLLMESGKLKLVINLLENLKETGHRTLVFSLSRKILDMIHRILVNKNWKVMRVDGTVTKIEDRERRIQKFQKDSSYPVFLLTTQVGGVGITLTAADRVIIYDPSWNPATDAQAVDRVYRIGQQKDVIVYRLITCGSVEEKIYRRQIFKDSITRQTTSSSADPYRYFSKQELRELFSLENPLYSATQVQLAEMHSAERQSDPDLENHITFLRNLNIFGISDHDLMFSRNLQDNSEDNDDTAVSDDFIKKQVSAAQQLITAEASVVAEGMRVAGIYNRPYQEVIPLPKKSVKDLYKPPMLPEVIDLTESAQDAFPVDKRKQNMPLVNSAIMNIEPLDFSAVVNERENTSSHSGISSRSPNNIPCSSPVKIESSIVLDNDLNVHSFDEESKNEEISVLEESMSVFKNDVEEVLRCEIPYKESDSNSTFNEIELLHNSAEISVIQDDANVTVEDKILSTSKQSPCLDSINSFEEMKSSNLGDLIPSPKQRMSVELKSRKLTSEFQEKFKSNLTCLMSDDLNDLSIDDQVSNSYLKQHRKSCARKSVFVISENEGSEEGSCPPSLNSTSNLVDESIHEGNSRADFSNKDSCSFVPDSAPTTPQIMKQKSFICDKSLLMTPYESPSSNLESLRVKFDNFSILRAYEGSVRGITPLKIDKNIPQQNSSFVQALAASPILSPPESPNLNEQCPDRQRTQNMSDINDSDSSESASDSPVKFYRKKKVQVLDSDCSDCDNEYKLSPQHDSVEVSDEQSSYTDNDESGSVFSQDTTETRDSEYSD